MDSPMNESKGGEQLGIHERNSKIPMDVRDEDNKENDRAFSPAGSTNVKNLLEQVKSLKTDLASTKHDLQMAAEFGTALLAQDQEKAKVIEKMQEEMNEQRELFEKLREEMTDSDAVKESLVEAQAECKTLLDRNVQLAQKLEKLNRENIDMGANMSTLEARLQSVVKDNAAKDKVLEDLRNEMKIIKEAQVAARSPSIDGKSLRRRSSTGQLSPSNAGGVLSPNNHNNNMVTPFAASGLRKKKSARFHSAKSGCSVRTLLDEDDTDLDEEEDDDEVESFDSDSEVDTMLMETPKGRKVLTRMQEKLQQARIESDRHKREVTLLRTALKKNTVEKQQSARKLNKLTEDISEYQELFNARSEMDVLRAGAKFDDEGGKSQTIEVVLMQEQLDRMKRDLDDAKKMATLRENDLENQMDQLFDLQTKLLKEEGKQVTVRKRPTYKGIYAAIDTGVMTDDIPDVTFSQRDGPNLDGYNVSREGNMSGPLLVKQGKKKRFGKNRWKARFAELRGPHLLLYRNEWDTKPSKVIPIDGCEVRIVRRPHLEEIGSRRGDFNVDMSKVEAKAKSNMFKNSFFKGAAQAHQEATLRRATRVLHEFHIWHPRRPVVYFSASSHADMSKWAEALQQQSTSVACRPRRFAAGYVTIVSEGQDMKRFFAVLRSDGLHLYKHPKKREATQVIDLDSNARIWKPRAEAKAMRLMEDIHRTFCIQTPQQGRNTLLADTDVDRDWWVESLNAHGMGIVSWGSVHGITAHDDSFSSSTGFGCLNV